MLMAHTPANVSCGCVPLLFCHVPDMQMEEVQLAPACIPLATDPERLEALQEAGRLLEAVQKVEEGGDGG